MKKRRAKRPDVLTLDATGRNLPPLSISEVLTKGTAVDVRCSLSVMGGMLAGDMWCHLLPSERKWLGEALMRIAAGQDANTVLRTKGRKNAAFRSIRDWQSLHYQLDDLRGQGASEAQAVRLIALFHCFERNGDRDPPEDEVAAEVERLKKSIRATPFGDG